MTDIQLLERAARAAGLDVLWTQGGIDVSTPIIFEGFGSETPWNPLEDDADAFRLMVSLSISLEQDASIEIDSFTYRGVTTGEYTQGVEAWFVTRTGVVIKAQEVYGTDLYAATRRCIVRVAAQLAEKY